ncbi:MAG TPA: ABC transporter permease, partial [Polyangiaceae bacterium]|nr:ABC transporter permease [Polyangiaceae bacterium]
MTELARALDEPSEGPGARPPELESRLVGRGRPTLVSSSTEGQQDSERLAADQQDAERLAAEQQPTERLAVEQQARERALLEQPRFLGSQVRSRRWSLLLRGLVPLLLVLGWWGGTSFGYIPPSVLASPGEVVSALGELHETGQLQAFLLASLSRSFWGVLLGVSVGLSLGVAAGWTSLGEELVDPTMQMLRAVPFLALVPLFISWFGIDEQFKIVLIAASSATPMYAYSYLGVRNVDRKIIEAARGFGLGGLRLLVQVVLPAALPNLLMALRICLSISVVGLIAAEQVGTTEGIGYLVLLAKQYYRQDY